MQVHSIYVVGLLVQQGRLAAVKRRRKPEPAFRCCVIAERRGYHLHIDDQKMFIECLTVKSKLHAFACRTARTIAGDIVFGFQSVLAVWGGNIKGYVVAAISVCDNLVQEPKVYQAGEFAGAIYEVLFDIIRLMKAGYLYPRSG